LFKTIKTGRISKFIWQNVLDCRASVIKKTDSRTCQVSSEEQWDDSD